MSSLKPFFSYFGGKYRAARLYPEPLYDVLCEPFAGSAGYSLRYPDRRVFLVDANPQVAGTWSYLIGATEREIKALPDLPYGVSVTELAVPQEARWLIGWWLNKGQGRPHISHSAWSRTGKFQNQFWGPQIRERIASQLQFIRHWRVKCGQYYETSNVPATWFVDAPYQYDGGHAYPASSRSIDYTDLASFCTSRAGQVIVCEGAAATWLPFERLYDGKYTNSQRRGRDHGRPEMLWTSAAIE